MTGDCVQCGRSGVQLLGLGGVCSRCYNANVRAMRGAGHSTRRLLLTIAILLVGAIWMAIRAAPLLERPRVRAWQLPAGAVELENKAR